MCLDKKREPKYLEKMQTVTPLTSWKSCWKKTKPHVNPSFQKAAGFNQMKSNKETKYTRWLAWCAASLAYLTHFHGGTRVTLDSNRGENNSSSSHAWKCQIKPQIIRTGSAGLQRPRDILQSLRRELMPNLLTVKLHIFQYFSSAPNHFNKCSIWFCLWALAERCWYFSVGRFCCIYPHLSFSHKFALGSSCLLLH